MMQCPECGRQIESGLELCPDCGAPLSGTPSEKPLTQEEYLRSLISIAEEMKQAVSDVPGKVEKANDLIVRQERELEQLQSKIRQMSREISVMRQELRAGLEAQDSPRTVTVSFGESDKGSKKGLWIAALMLGVFLVAIGTCGAMG